MVALAMEATKAMVALAMEEVVVVQTVLMVRRVAVLKVRADHRCRDSNIPTFVQFSRPILRG
jgi:hypothetical protein